jgi:solute carrier family 25 phosphate transporter 23/24/25/41
VQSVDSKDLNLRKLWHFLINEGKWHSMWRGNWVNVLKTAPENAIRLATYEKLKQLLNEHNFNQSGVNTFGEKLLCGSTAGLCATLVLYPLKTVKTLMNLGHTGEYLSINHCIRQTYLMHGFAAFYKGLMAHSAAIIPSAGIDLATYETLKKK